MASSSLPTRVFRSAVLPLIAPLAPSCFRVLTGTTAREHCTQSVQAARASAGAHTWACRRAFMASSSLSTRVFRSSVLPPMAPLAPSRCWCAGMASSSAFTRALMGICSSTSLSLCLSTQEIVNCLARHCRSTPQAP